MNAKFEQMLPNARWIEIDTERAMGFVDRIVERETWLAEIEKREPLTSRDAVVSHMATQNCEMFFGTDWYSKIRVQPEELVPASEYPTGRQLDCGCIVYNASDVMVASTGTACQNCYDRMSE